MELTVLVYVIAVRLTHSVTQVLETVCVTQDGWVVIVSILVLQDITDRIVNFLVSVTIRDHVTQWVELVSVILAICYPHVSFSVNLVRMDLIVDSTVTVTINHVIL